MAVLDLRTILISFIFGNLICSILLSFLWRQNRSRYHGLEFWMLSFAANFVGITLIAGREQIPNFLSIMLGNLFLIFGLFFLYFGLERFLLNRGAPFHLYALVIINTIFQAYFIYVYPSYEMRTLGFSITLLLFSIQYGWLFFRGINVETRKITRNLGIITSIFGLLAIIRIITNILIPPGTGLYQSAGYEALLYLSFHILYIILTISLFTLVNRRLFTDLENDVLNRKRMEQMLSLRLKLWDYSLTHSPLQVMEEALDEIESITKSQVGFYHIVDEDTDQLSIQAWSTRTKNEFCKAVDTSVHLPIRDAGVWADCIREQKPVIHNDYVSLFHKNGLPSGHFKLVRELVLPIIQKGKVVTVLGIGNKPTDYDEKDVEFVEYIASLVWIIVSKMKSDEKIQNLNTRLEELAMTDELTGLPNRRYFFGRGQEEISRSLRYNTPLSLIMLDIDKFKTINDTYGHEAGDKALKCIAKTLKEIPRVVDLPARLGGEEFGVLLPNTQLKNAVILAERLRKSIEELHCQREDIPITLTASLGVAAFQADMKNLDDLLRNADSAMYQAKNRGRNRVEQY